LTYKNAKNQDHTFILDYTRAWGWRIFFVMAD
jgi:hypothetical protein